MAQQIKSILKGWLIHLGIVQAAITLTYVINYNRPGINLWQYFQFHTFERPDVLITALTLLLIEINYRFYRELYLVLFMLSCLLIGGLSLTGHYYLNLDQFAGRHAPFPLALYVAGYALAYTVIRHYLNKQTVRNEVRLKNELSALKAQLNPHFLFNSLNYLYGTALAEKAAQTADGIDKLSSMMRYTITGIHEDFVPLKNELDFIECYLALQQARLPEKEHIKIEISLPSTCVKTLRIAPLIILPFIENAFKYGINMDDPCFVNLKIDITGTSLSMTVSNSISSRPVEIKGNNTGIQNTIKRLKLLYPGKYTLHQTNTGTEYTTLLTLTLLP